MARRRGGYLRKQPDLAGEISRAVVAAAAVADKPVTLKLRQSFDDSDESREDFFRIAEAAFDAGVAGLCVHARTVRAMYTGRADWDWLTETKRHFHDKTIIGSGDVSSPAQSLRMLQETGVDAVAVARGALGNPWFFSQVRSLAAGLDVQIPSLDEQRQLIGEHFDHACDLYGPARGSKIMRKFGIKYARNHPSPKLVREAFVAVRTPVQWHEVLQQYYDPNQYDRANSATTP